MYCYTTFYHNCYLLFVSFACFNDLSLCILTADVPIHTNKQACKHTQTHWLSCIQRVWVGGFASPATTKLKNQIRHTPGSCSCSDWLWMVRFNKGWGWSCVSHGNEPLKLKIYLFFSFLFSLSAFGMGWKVRQVVWEWCGGQDGTPPMEVRPMS